MRSLRQMPAYQFILRADEGLRAAGITLAGDPPEESPIHATGLVASRGDAVQPAPPRHTRAKADVGAAPRHVRSDGDATRLACQRDDGGFLGQPRGVEDMHLQPTRDEAAG